MRQRAEKRLLAEIRAGRREACARLVSANYAAVYRFLVHLTGDPGLAEDLTQETFATAWLKISGFRADGSVRAWLHRIAYRKFVDAHRARQRAAVLSQRLSAEPTGVPQPGPMQQLVAADNSRRLYRAVQALDEDSRVVIVLHYLQGMSYREMAQVLGEPTGTVKWRTNRALSRLRESLAWEADIGSKQRTTMERSDQGVSGEGLARPAPADGASRA